MDRRKTYHEKVARALVAFLIFVCVALVFATLVASVSNLYDLWAHHRDEGRYEGRSGGIQG